jgi:PAS domain S-box-containing protein
MSETDEIFKLKLENEHLQARLRELEEALASICIGSVDSILVSTVEGEKIFTLKTQDQPYRLFVENMNLAAVLIAEDDTVLYCNQAFAGMIKDPAETVVGKKIQTYLPEDCIERFNDLLQKSRLEHPKQKQNFSLQASDGSLVPTRFSLSQIQIEDFKASCIVAIDLSEQN